MTTTNQNSEEDIYNFNKLIRNTSLRTRQNKTNHMCRSGSLDKENIKNKVKKQKK